MPNWYFNRRRRPGPPYSGAAPLVNTPSAYQTFQRNGSNVADIDISGTVGTDFGGGSMEARFRGGAWTTLGSIAGNGTWSGTLSAQSGQGTLEVRVVGQATTTSVAYVGVGDVYCVAGQSNATGEPGAVDQSYTHATLKATAFYKDYVWRDCTDPLGRGPFTDTIIGEFTEDTGGTVWVGMATTLLSTAGVPIAFVPCANGASRIQWWQAGDDHLDRASRYGAVNYRCQQAGGVKAILWWQGETDALNNLSKSDYKTYLQALADDLYADLGAPLMACTLLNCSALTAGQMAAINDAITESYGTHNILAGPDLSDTASDDTYHALTQPTISTCASRWATALETAFY